MGGATEFESKTTKPTPDLRVPGEETAPRPKTPLGMEGMESVAPPLNLKVGADTPFLKLPIGVEGVRSADTTGERGADVAARTKNDQLVGDLVTAIDRSARSGLAVLAGKSRRPEEANPIALQLGGRIDHLLSAVASAREIGMDVSAFKQDAAIALGRAEEFARELAQAGGVGDVRRALDRAAPELASRVNWTWSPVKADQPKVGDGLRRRDGFDIGIDTLAMVERRARAASIAKDGGAVKSACSTCQADLSHANSELATAMSTNDPALKNTLTEAVFSLGTALADLEGAAYRVGIGEDASVNGMRDEETAVRKLAGFATQRAFWDSAVPTVNAILDILDQSVKIENGHGYAKGHPAQHPEVPPRYHPLLQQWFDIVAGIDSNTKAKLRGPSLATHLDAAIGQTAALTNLIEKESTPGTADDLLDVYWTKVSAFRHRALEQTVMDPIDAKAETGVAKGDSPIDHLDQEDQIKLASTRLMTVARALTTSASRLGSAGKNEAEIALKAFEDELANAPIAAALKQELASAKNLADVAQHLAGLASSIDAVMSIADQKRRDELFHKNFDKYGIPGGASEIAKTFGQLVQGGVAAYSVAAYAFLRAKGLTAAAASKFASASKAISNIGIALNVLNLVHGLVLLIEGEGGVDKISGAVEIAVGTLGLVGKAESTLARFTGPLAASILIGWTTIKWLGETTMGALAGMIRLALNPVFDNMRTNAHLVHGEAMKLAIMIETHKDSPPKDPEQLGLLQEQIKVLTHVLAGSIKGYVVRTQSGGGRSDTNPGAWKAFALRFKPLVGVRLDTPDEVLLAADQFLTIVVACFNTAGQILEESVEQAADEQG